MRVCEYGVRTSEKVALVLGDSVALSWMPSIEQALVSDGWRVVGAGFASCPFVEVETYDTTGRASFLNSCSRGRQRMLDLAAEIDPDVVFLASAQSSFLRLASGASGEGAQAEWEEGLETSLAMLRPYSDNIVVLSNPPMGEDPAQCGSRYLTPQHCVGDVGPVFKYKAVAEEAAVRDASRGGATVTYLDTKEWFCNREDICPLVVDGTVVRADTSHLTNAYAERLGRVLSEALVENGARR
jgi:hypothetical protein